MYKNYLCIINIENEVDLYKIKSYEGEDTRNLYVMIDLENLYDNILTVNSDIVNIRQGLYAIFDKNQRKHLSNFDKMITEGQSIFSYIDKLNRKKNQYEEYLQKLYSMIDTINQSEKEKMEKIQSLREEYESAGGIHSDIQKSHIISKYEGEIEEIKSTKHKVVKNIFNIRNKLDDMVLYTDKVFFDNLVMIDAIIKNINSLNII
jgi:predicted  nucleic acid-binding Zn-ribbon protein